MPRFKPSYRRSIKSYIRRRLTGRGTALKHPIKSTYRAKQVMTKRRMKKLSPAVMGPRAREHAKMEKYFRGRK